ncbi:MAG: copper amine oxidase N-terminal domain-containing protein [Fimbriimonadaceae bacterium]
MTTNSIFKHGRAICVLALASLSIVGVANQAPIRATVDGTLVYFADMQPEMIRGRVMVPVRGVFEHMKANVEWDSQTRTVTAHKGADTIRIPVDSYKATVNGEQVNLDAPARERNGRVMVPLRFLSESLDATVEWVASSRTVEIMTASPVEDLPPMMTVVAGTVMPLSLSQKLSSKESRVGDIFKASLDTNGLADYQGIPNGSILEGHIDSANAKNGNTPGVLGLSFDRIRLPDGQIVPVTGTLIGLDKDSVIDENGRLVAKPGKVNDNLKYVGIGAGGGALIAILGKGNLLTNTLIGGALGFLFAELQKDPAKARDVTLESGSKFGVRLTRELMFRQGK